MKLAYTRALLTAALNGSLDEVAYAPDPIFGVEVPESCPGYRRRSSSPRTNGPTRQPTGLRPMNSPACSERILNSSPLRLPKRFGRLSPWSPEAGRGRLRDLQRSHLPCRHQGGQKEAPESFVEGRP